MSERKIPIYLECGYSIAMQVLGGKWKICIIEALRDKPPPLPLVCNEGEMVERFQRKKDSFVSKKHNVFS